AIEWKMCSGTPSIRSASRNTSYLCSATACKARKKSAGLMVIASASPYRPRNWTSFWTWPERNTFSPGKGNRAEPGTGRDCRWGRTLRADGWDQRVSRNAVRVGGSRPIRGRVGSGLLPQAGRHRRLRFAGDYQYVEYARRQTEVLSRPR